MPDLQAKGSNMKAKTLGELAKYVGAGSAAILMY